MKLHIPSIPMSHLMFTAFAVAVSVSTLSAATSTWNGGGGVWETNSNWTGGVPGNGDTAFLPGYSPNTIVINGTTAAIASLQTENTNAAWVLTNGVLAFRTNASGSITTPLNGNTGSLTIYSQITASNLVITGSRIDIYNTNNDITGTITVMTNSRIIFRAPGVAGSATFNLRNSTQLQLGAGVFTNDIILQGGNNMGVYGFGLAGKTLEIAGNISEVSGPRDMVFSTLNDNATVVISGSNSYTGNTTIGRNSTNSDTTIRITHDNAFGSSNLVKDVTFSSVANTGAQTLEMSGGITVVNRNLTLFGAGIGSKGSLFNASGNNTWDGGIDLGITNNPTIGVTNGTTLTVKGKITGNAVDGLTKAGGGTLIFEGDNSYSTGTKINAGTLELKASSGSALGGTASVTVSSGATLLLSKSDQVNNSASVTLSGGTIKRESGVSEVFGNLNLTTASFLDYGTGSTGTLTFGTYTPSSLLTVNNFLAGNTLLFSSDLTSTVTNGAYFSFDNSFNYNWDGGTSTFTITAIPETSAYVACVGLVGLLFLSFGFRFRKPGEWRHSGPVRRSLYFRRFFSEVPNIVKIGENTMKTTNIIPSIPMPLLMITAFAVAVSVSTLSAATSTWNGGGGDWETNSNWAGGVPGNGDTAFIPGNSPNTITITGTTAAIASLQTENTSAAWVLTNGVLAFRTNASGSITTPLNGNTGSLTIHSQITASNLVITGSRIDIYNTNNDITGTITMMTNSRVIFRAPGVAGSATFNLRQGSQLQLGAGVFTNDIIIQGGSSAGVYGFGLASKTLEVAGNISEVSGPRDMVFSALNDNATIVISGSNSYSGNTTIGRNSATSDTTIRITHDNAFGSSNAVANVTFLSTTNTGAQTLEMSGGITVVNRNLTLFGAGIGSKGSLFNASGNNTWDGGIDLGITNNPTIGVTNGTTLTVKGEITGNVVGGLTKTGAGALILEGDSSYSTGTTVSQGLLLVENTTGSGTGSGDVLVLSGAAIGGDGTIAGSLDIASGGKFEFTLNSTLKVSSNITFGGFSINDVVVADWNSVSNGTYTLIGGDGTFNYDNVDFDTILDLGGGRTAALQQGSLQMQVVPEPGTLWLLGLAGLGVVLLRGRCRLRSDA